LTTPAAGNDHRRVHIVDIAIPLPSVLIPFSKDEKGRNTAEIPGIGKIVELEKSDADVLRETMKGNPSPETVGFDLTFQDGRRGLFVRAIDLDDTSSKAVSA
jgi:hypothetical protein